MALSSRNMYLNDDDRESAVALNRALRAGQAVASSGVDTVMKAAVRCSMLSPVSVSTISRSWRLRPSYRLSQNTAVKHLLLVAAFVGNDEAHRQRLGRTRWLGSTLG